MIRHTSTIEADWLIALVGKYGEDVAKMTRDRKLNVWQKTAGEIKRASVFLFLLCIFLYVLALALVAI